MFDIGWQEFILVTIVAVVVIGPKDLPRVIRTVGQWVRKARSLASEFQGSLEEMAREAELDDVRKQIQQVSKEGIGASIGKHVDPTGELRQSFEDAKASTGAEDIQSAFDEARRDVRSIGADPGSGARTIDAGTVAPLPDDPVAAPESYEDIAARNRIPGNSVTPPAATEADPAAPPSGEPLPAEPNPGEPDGKPKSGSAGN